MPGYWVSYKLLTSCNKSEFRRRGICFKKNYQNEIENFDRKKSKFFIHVNIISFEFRGLNFYIFGERGGGYFSKILVKIITDINRQFPFRVGSHLDTFYPKFIYLPLKKSHFFLVLIEGAVMSVNKSTPVLVYLY